MKLLYAEDEIAMSEAVTDILTYHNYMVDTVDNGLDALEYARTDEYDGIILDVMMPKMSGIEVLKTLRDEGCLVPILLLTARTQVEDKIEGLDLGADDYLPKPFNMGELLARVRAMLRRRETFTPDIIKYRDISLNMNNSMLMVNGHTEVLSKLEYRIMEALILNQGRYISTEDLLVRGWGYDTDAELGTVWVYISNLRKKLAGFGSSVEIKAKRNIGYILE